MKTNPFFASLQAYEHTESCYYSTLIKMHRHLVTF